MLIDQPMLVRNDCPLLDIPKWLVVVVQQIENKKDVQV